MIEVDRWVSMNLYLWICIFWISVSLATLTNLVTLAMYRYPPWGQVSKARVLKLLLYYILFIFLNKIVSIL